MNTSIAMNGRDASPAWIKLAAGLGALWYAFGLLQFWLAFSVDTAAAVAADHMTAAHAAAIDGTPFLIWVAFALASFAGLVGAFALFGPVARAKMAFSISLVSALVYYAWVYGLSGTGSDRPAEETIIAAVVLAVTAGFTLLSTRLARR